MEATPGGWAGDSTISFIAGHARPADTRLIGTAFEALEAGIAAAVVGNRIGPSRMRSARSAATRDSASRRCSGPSRGPVDVRGPGVPDEGRPGRGIPLRHGMALAIEPLLIGGGTDAFHPEPQRRRHRRRRRSPVRSAAAAAGLGSAPPPDRHGQPGSG
ncbi:M24 family metallopeptidase [Streptomyces sp. NPDC006510]|uniref:M24 family metallopeptidase n=1 Tax=Streptomyces sp. NPDC006510 TaxID=3155600 RepID=UPI0033BDFE8A